jgi:hypothetical protein
MTDIDMLKEFTHDVNKSQMSIHAYTMYISGVVEGLELLQLERANMQRTHQATISSLRSEKLQ